MLMCFVYILHLIDFHCERQDETAVNSDKKQNIAIILTHIFKHNMPNYVTTLRLCVKKTNTQG